MAVRVVTKFGLRVLFVNDIAFILETLCPALVDLGVRPQVVGRHPSGPYVGGTSFACQVSNSWMEMQQAQPYDLLHINYGLFGFLGLAAPRHPFVLHLHGDDIRATAGAKNHFSNLTSRFAARFAADVWYSTPDLGPTVRGLGIDARYVPSPVAGAFTQLSPTPSAASYVLFATPLSRIKGAEVSVQAMQVLARDAPALPLAAFGFGPDPVEAERLRRQIPPTVRLLPWTPHHRVPALFADALVVVGQLRLGILGLLELESLASARPVIMHLNRDLYKQEPYYSEPPPVLEATTPAEVAEGVLRVVSSESLRGRLGGVSRMWVTRFHMASNVAKLYRDRYQSLLASGG